MENEQLNSGNTFESLSILWDNVFKAVFTKDTEQSKGALRCLISALIGQNIDIIDQLANEPAIDDIHDRQIRYDIHCKVRETQEQINVEMTVYPDVLEELRLEFLGACRTCRFFALRPAGSGRKTFDNLASFGSLQGKNRLEARFFL
ncbi:hypothetical protein FACS1894151_00660 [Spirochaetia bacterium]|nr:hypothetical protein FACS1894151_00660 [Spirochaetia bacterium]